MRRSMKQENRSMNLRQSPLVYRWMIICWAVPVTLAQLIFTWQHRRQMQTRTQNMMKHDM